MQAFYEVVMIVGIVKESPAWEYRVAVVPQTVKQLITDGHTVNIETGAGERAGFSDEQYQEAGANILHTAADVYEKSEFIAKIWAPKENEYVFIFSFNTSIDSFDSGPV